jgi:RimJ/RimL family protein N-acetyltransferase
MVTLQPMTPEEYQAYLEPAIAEYAQGHVEDGQWSADEALQRAREEFHSLLPNGVNTPKNYLFTLINDEHQKVGMIWFAMREGAGAPFAWIYDVQVDEAFRRRGYAQEAFAQLEPKVKALGGNRISLHVFGNNHGARDLYAKLGYAETNVLMSKTLAG